MSSLPPAKPRIVLPEASHSEVVFRAASLLGERQTVVPVILGRREDFVTAAAALGIPFRGVQCIYPADDPGLEVIVEWLREFLPDHADAVRARILAEGALFAAGLAALGRVEGIALSGMARARYEIVGLAPRAFILEEQSSGKDMAEGIEGEWRA